MADILEHPSKDELTEEAVWDKEHRYKIASKVQQASSKQLREIACIIGYKHN